MWMKKRILFQEAKTDEKRILCKFTLDLTANSGVTFHYISMSRMHVNFEIFFER